MELGTYGLALRRHLPLIVLMVLLGLAAGTAAFLVRPADYASTARLFVRVDIATNGTDLAQGTTYTQLVSKSFATVASSPFVLEPVSRGSSGRYSVADLQSRLDVEVEPSTSIIDVTLRLPVPDDARRYADTIAEQTVDAVGALIPTSAGGAPIATITPVQAASRAELVNPNALLQDLVLGAGAGLVLGLVLALLADRLQRRLRDTADVRRHTPVPFLGTYGPSSGRDDGRRQVLSTEDAASGHRAVTALAALATTDSRARVVALVDASPGTSSDAAALLLDSAVQLGLAAQLYDLAAEEQDVPARQGRRVLNTAPIDLRLNLRSVVEAARGYNDLILVRADRGTRLVYEMFAAKEVDATVVVAQLGMTTRRELTDALDLASTFASPELFVLPFRDTTPSSDARPAGSPKAGRGGPKRRGSSSGPQDRAEPDDRS